ncbi:hypothetical protein Tco_1204812 [Tanacetum coccineum]
MNIYNMKLEQFQVKTKFLNTLPPEWSVTDVKLVQDLHTTKVDQLHAYLGQHEFHANEMRYTWTYTPGGKWKLSGKNKGLLFVTTAKGKAICPNSALNLRGNGIILGLRIKYALAEVNNHDNMNNNMINQVVQAIPSSEQSNVVNHSETEITSDSNIIPYSKKVLKITTLKDDLRKLKGKALVDKAITKHTINLEMLKIDMEPITPKLLNKRTAHSAYIKHTQEEAAALRDLVDHVKANYPLDHSLESACSNTKKDKIQQTPSSTQKNKVEAYPRKVKSSLKNKDCVVAPKGTTHVQHSKLNASSELKYV